MRVLALAVALITTLGVDGDKPAIRLKAGDTVVITSPYGGEFHVMPDGAIYGRGFGRLVIAGKTWDEAQSAARKALHDYVREDEVNLILKELRRDSVYLVGVASGKGPVDLLPDMTLRQLLASTPMDGNTDQFEVQLFRNGAKVCDVNAAKLLAGDSEAPDQKLSADDIVNVAPTPFVRIWVTGFVAKAGQLKLPAGTDVAKAIAEAGGIHWPELSADAPSEKDVRVVIRRGPNTIEVQMREDLKGNPVPLESGDTVSVLAPEDRHITVAGEVAKPGEVVMRGEHSLTGAIAMAGGVGADGTLANVLILRKSELYQVDARTPVNGTGFKPFALEADDLVYVQRNLRTFVVLGQVNKPGQTPMKDGKSYRLSDAIAEAGGLDSRGSFRRVFVSHPDATGKVLVRQFNLDEFLKDGNQAANPEIDPGDCILVGQPKGITLGSVAQFMSSALVFQNLVGGIKK